ncbi:MAG: S-layer protein, partial [Candidatus Micrarchaeota archaeon]|nr:S-layer protein [Candidatus Micrarchaeota archaeon]
INSAGQPVVQVVVGSTAQPSDGVVAANIAAVIGNLAYTTTPITATVTNTAGVSCTVTTPTCTLSNSQVWLGEKGSVTAAGSYNLKALIGSVLNGAVLNAGTVGASKATQSGSSNQYSYPQTNSPFAVTSTPTSTSAFAGLGALGVNSSVVSTTNGGGLTFSQLSIFSTSQYFDNVVQLTSSQVPGLLTNSGNYQETESLWLEGFPVYDQAAGVQ